MKVVLDASSILAIIFEEAGADAAIDESDGALLSAVNLDEILHKCVLRKVGAEDVDRQLRNLGVEIAPFDAAAAKVTAALHPRVARTGTSFADRACLALGIMADRPILTCDGKWMTLGLDLDIRMIR